MNKKVPLQHYQFVRLEEAFHLVEKIEVNNIAQCMNAFLPPKYFTYYHEPVPLNDKELLKTEIIKGGSCAYEALINAANSADCPELSDMLRGTKLHLLYRWVWVWSADNEIMTRGNSWFVSREECLREGRENRPRYHVYDGIECPRAQVSVEPVCPCMVHRVTDHQPSPGEEILEGGSWGQDVIDPPCPCFYPYEAPAYTKTKREGEIKVDGLTITRTNFQPEYQRGNRYIIKDTKETFSSLHIDIYAAYMEKKRRLINCSLGL